MIVVLGELGGCDEYSLVAALKQGNTVWSCGSQKWWRDGVCLPAQAKNQALCDAGAVDPTSYEAFDTVIKEAFEKLAEEGKISLLKEVKLHKFPRILISLLRVENSELQLILSPPYQMAEAKSHAMLVLQCLLLSNWVMGAHNSIVSARAGKDLVSSLVEDYVNVLLKEGLAPYEFVERMKKKSICVPGIGHSQPGLLTCYCSFQIDQERQQHR
ncbi:ATP-citrate synthase beta chain protein 1-like [Actinidia eriantha]|uniref:ATP-citrate synthase beta chain protein 1-like n=1 Tax=Actinidia eriantha TaxID=165200 RepID=UPI00258BA820|nr:ATP-citrate synthase beta chain protein 1-like [Actinidia eriantha]